jgi:hypothetical protein
MSGWSGFALEPTKLDGPPFRFGLKTVTWPFSRTRKMVLISLPAWMEKQNGADVDWTEVIDSKADAGA